MRNNLLLIASLLLVGVMSTSVSATEIHPVKGNWYLFDVDEVVSLSGGTEWIDAQNDELLGYSGDGSALTFSFSLTNSALLNLVDAGLAGDVFTLLINGINYTSSTVAASSAAYVGIDLDAAWVASEFSRLSVLLAPGDYTVTGFLKQSAADEYGSPYLATVGGLKIVDVDESGIFALFGIGAFMLLFNRQKWRIAAAFSGKGVEK